MRNHRTTWGKGIRIIVLTGIVLQCKILTAMAQEIRDVRPPVDYPRSGWWLLVMTGIFLLAVAAGWFWWRQRRRQERKAVPTVMIPPWERAYQQLTELQAAGLPQQGRVKEFYSRLSDIVRHYIEERFLIRAPEMTTEEFLFSLQNHQVFKARQAGALRNFLTQSDMVKFAKHMPAPTETEESFDLARTLVDETRPASGDSAATSDSKP